ncbi:(+)-trans-carveol dehydrogenase [Pseudoclavibacter sp. JAI123]|uniref:SDR family oxidoreductase n=1 Tax=Pseudoclavibacter sp. JAI123 TaxID=2723065 RepID=UPI0017F89ADC|nr:SDR family oxidoreductase [Pseudoclavibacter sp. JAI123]NYF12432.1 (+)-trans-carveol dehydrogenase [Pseudoclavibacter sp. JAI123]
MTQAVPNITGRLTGSTALITGAAGGIGSATARRLAEEGANVVALDRASSGARLAEVVAEVTALGVRALAVHADVTEQASLNAAVEHAVAELGAFDIVFANAGVIGSGLAENVTEEDWNAQIDVNLGGVWRTLKAAIPVLKAEGSPGSVIITSSSAGLRAAGGGGTYAAAKHGLVGLARAWAHELGPYGVRVNTIHPTAVATPLVMNDANLRASRPDLEHPTPDDVRELWSRGKLLDIGWIEPVDVANAVLFLASPEARYITGIQLPIDAGSTTKWG